MKTLEKYWWVGALLAAAAVAAFLFLKRKKENTKTEWDKYWEKGTDEFIVSSLVANGKTFTNVRVRVIKGSGISGTDIWDVQLGLAPDGTKLRTKQMASSAPHWVIEM